MFYHIITESTADLPKALCERYQIHVIPMRFIIDGKEYRDDPMNIELTSQDFYQLLREGKTSSTAAVNLLQFEEAFIPILEQGEDILYLSFSSVLSSTYGTASLLVEELRERYPERCIEVIDTRCASIGEGLLACLASIRRKQGQSIQEVAQWIKSEGASRLQHWFTVDDLMHLYRGGRLNVISAMVGGALGIKPILHVNADGSLVPFTKVRGRRASIVALADRMEEQLKESDPTLPVFIGHADARAEAETLRRIVLERFGPRKIEIAPVGPVIGSHVGPGMLALFFLGAAR